eukprot:CAMPEP_0204258232 /NCGR_PEP_ID=MMETSP0468-20130131/4874_1 /ASSEMBLY_ACC=CAM_ASM_000383 /TAXON_ID=2969 /ORGANISM="Oxyrrhis marina" /LENGTH=491 /DNA_ID=CAMNT_0051232413 /DNA_START=99 /DNA_END=1574 /DNA_ORIENTATION=-
MRAATLRAAVVAGLVGLASGAHLVALDREVEVGYGGEAHHVGATEEATEAVLYELQLLAIVVAVCMMIAKGTQGATKRKILEAPTSDAVSVPDPAVLSPKRLNALILDCRTVQEILQVVEEHGEDLNPVNVATCVYRVARTVKSMRIKGCRTSVRDTVRSPGWVRLLTLVDSRLPALQPQSLSNILWAFATLSWAPRDGLLERLCAAATQQVAAFNPQDLANTAWALSSLKHRDEKLMRGLGRRSLEVLEHFRPQAISNLVYAFAVFEILDEDLLQAVSQRILLVVDRFTPEDLANSAWALASLGQTSSPALPCLLAAAHGCVRSLSTHNISSIAWAAATAGQAPAGLMGELAELSLGKLAHFSHRGLSSTMWGLAEAGVRHDGLLRAVEQVVRSKVQFFHAGEIATMTNALARFNTDAAVLAVVYDHCATKIAGCAPKHLRLIVEAMAATPGAPNAALLDAVAGKAASEDMGGEAEAVESGVAALRARGH